MRFKSQLRINPGSFRLRPQTRRMQHHPFIRAVPTLQHHKIIGTGNRTHVGMGIHPNIVFDKHLLGLTGRSQAKFGIC